MLVIKRNSTDPYFNLAAEEYLVKNIEEPCFMIWQNAPSVIVGKHQNPIREVNLSYTKKKNIPVIRRISGGGTVYHDLGNINYSFIDLGKQESLVNFKKYSQPILQLLNELEVNAQLTGKSDLTINGLKFSGNASHVYRNKVLHHGTLLFNSDLNILNESIKIQKVNIQDKAVNSNRSKVGNISDFLKQNIQLNDFKDLLIKHIKNIFPNSIEIDFSEDEILKIEKLAEEKYKQWEWNFGYSPKYTLNSIIEIDNTEVHFTTDIHKGFIKSIQTASNIPEELMNAISSIINHQHEKSSILNALNNSFSNLVKEMLLKILF